MTQELLLVMRAVDGKTDTIRYTPGSRHPAQPGIDYRLIVDGAEQLQPGTRIARRGRDLVVTFTDGQQFEILQWSDVEDSRLSSVGALALNAHSSSYVSADEVLSGESPVLGTLAVAKGGFDPIGLLGEEGGHAGFIDGLAQDRAPGLLATGVALAVLGGFSVGSGGVIKVQPESAVPEPTGASTDPSGSVSPPTNARAAAKELDLIAATDSGKSLSDDITSDATPIFRISSVPPGSNPQLYVDGVATASIFDPSSNTLTPVVPLTDGVHFISYKLADSAGVETAESVPLRILVDTTAPQLDLNREDASTLAHSQALTGKGFEYSLDNGKTQTVTDAAVVEETSIDRITIDFSRNASSTDPRQLNTPQNGSNEQLLIAGQTLNLDGSVTPAELRYAGVLWRVDFSEGVCTLSADSPASSAAAQALLRNLRYIDNSTTPLDNGQGNRHFEITLLDTAGNSSPVVTSTLSSDNVSPAIDLDGALGSNNQTRAANVFGLTDLVDPANTLITEDRSQIQSVRVRLAGVLDGANESIHVAGGAIGDVNFPADGSGTAADARFILENTPWRVGQASDEFIFTSETGVVSVAQAQSLLRALQYRNDATHPSDGSRIATLTAVDGAGNVTAEPAVSRLLIDGERPGAAIDLTPGIKVASDPLFTLDADLDGTLGDRFILRFSEPVRVAPITSLANWSLSAGTSLGNGATISARNAIQVNGESYASTFEVQGGDFPTYAEGTTLSIVAANVIGTGGPLDTAIGPISFVMTDITAPAAPVAPQVVNPDNTTRPNSINSSEASAPSDIRFTHQAASVGDSLRLYRDGSLIRLVPLTAGDTSTAISLGGLDWGIGDGVHQLTAQHLDAAGNQSPYSLAKLIHLDTVLSPGTAAMSMIQDVGNPGSANAGDVLRVTFNEAVSLNATGIPSALFGGAGLNAVPVGGIGIPGVAGSAIHSAVWDITLGAGATLSGGESLNFNGVVDTAGNAGSLSTVVPANLYNTARSILIDSVTSDNVIDSNERALARSVDVLLQGARVNDTVRLYMDGVQVGVATASSDGQSRLTVNLDPGVQWGADGERSLYASIQRDPASELRSDYRSVYVAADRPHWSNMGGVIWFDPDNISQQSGSPVLQWLASSGDSIATAYRGSSPEQLPMLLRNAANSHSQVYFSGGTANSNDTAQGGWLSFTDPNAYLASGDSAFTTIASAVLAQGGNWRQITGVGGFRDAGQSDGAVGLGVGDTGSMLFAPGHQSPPYLSPSNSFVPGAQALAAQTYTPGTLSLYSNGELIALQSSHHAIELSTNPAQADQQRLIGAARDGTGNHQVTELWQGLIGDVIWINRALGAAELQEIQAYEAVKFGSAGRQVSPGSDAAIHDLSVSANRSTLLDDVLTLNNAASSTGSALITTAGADYVHSGAGNDLIRVRDLDFRELDAGGGFDTISLDSGYSGPAALILSDFVSNARGVSGNSTADTRVNAAGYHGLLGFERVDLESNRLSQTIRIDAADVDQLAGKTLANDPQAAGATSNLYLTLGANDYLDAGVGFAASPTYGYWLDAAGTAYDRKFTASVGTDDVSLYVRGGDDAPDFSARSNSAAFDDSSMTLHFAEPMTPTALLAAGDFFGVGVNSVSDASVGLDESRTVLTVNGSFDPTQTLKITYLGSLITDLRGDELRYRNISIGVADVDLLDKSYGTVDYALFGNAGNDTITAGQRSDLIVGGAGNDTLTGGTGADTFRAIYREDGIDTLTDFDKNQGDKIDLRSLLAGSGFELGAGLNRFLELTASGTDLLLKVDTAGIGGFAEPEFSYLISNANVAGNLLGMSLTTLIDQRIVLV